MQNFKQFLSESPETFAYLDFYISYADEPDDYDSVQSKIISAIKLLKIPGLEVTGYSSSSLNIEIRFDLNWLKTNQQNLPKYQIQILDTISPLLKPTNLDLQFTKSDITLRTIPDFVVEWDNIIINAQRNASLKDIHKFIKCDELVIEDAGYVSSNILGLLLIDKKTTIEIMGSPINNKWIPIVKKYIKGTRDILECQEELITNGLRQYAKL
jgi:hypothetical protein